MKDKKNNRNKWLHLRLSEDERKEIEANFKASGQGNFSDYSRSIMLSQPIIKGYRNQSLQDVIAELTLLRGELKSIGNNFNQAVHKLHLLKGTPEIKAWFVSYELEKRMLLKKIEDIHFIINKSSLLWLQS
ncbi:plasmid mobilization relaxosome protein MobC [Mucilaginibacter sp. SMC90]|uniref:plasmid mobilization protein n=1 Tax=Mucilaginibacter sp. SMC90 TaxID=2929803 RepID=UPI001FB448A7|nr:plasmid mobilization relaxosome protein MobC [Mucilaginibacter sp. SMC90]UOE51306.1 plasmid mobilization relaxosome protein MobC [Mucilaginibacter sp. SMC90]